MQLNGQIAGKTKMREPKALAQKEHDTHLGCGGECSVLSPERLGRIALCTFGIRVEHGILQNAIRFQSGAHGADLRVLLLRWMGKLPPVS